MTTEKLTNKDISVGQVLLCSVYDDQDVLLLQKGSIISSERQLISLLERGLYTNEKESKASSPAAKPVDDSSSPFDRFHNLLERTSGLFSAIILKKDNIQEKVYKYCDQILSVCEEYPDASIGAIHLCQENPYSICHSLHVALLAGITAKSSGYDRQHSRSLMAAALTSNISMIELQEILHHQQAPLTDEQKRQVNEHCHESVRMLREAGVKDEQWLKIVLQHHERPDGKGYPFGIANNEILHDSQILSISDRYSAMISPRSYRKPMTSKLALREFFLCKNKDFSEVLILSFIKEMGIFPPGAFVTLKNGETAVVTKKTRNKMWPVVSSILGPKGEPYARPMRRDTNDERYKIKDTCTLDKPPHMNLNMIWGY